MFRGLKFFLSIIAILSLSAEARDYYCYVPGAGGLGQYMEKDVTAELHQRGIPFVAFPITSKGDVKERAAEFITLFEQLIAQDADARCHLYAFSMGGLVIRYAANHLDFAAAEGVRLPLRERVITQTSISSPHFGTPLANFLKQNYPGLKPGLEDLSEEALQKMNDPDSADYSPVIEGIPFYSYRTFVRSRDDIGGVLGKIGFQFITHFLEQAGRNPMNDGIVPFESMGFGVVLQDLERAHEFMSYDDGGSPTAIDVLVEHWNYLHQGE
jgi:hypothetical protein